MPRASCDCGECRKCKVRENTQRYLARKRGEGPKEGKWEFDGVRMLWPADYFGLRMDGRYGQYDGEVSTAPMRTRGKKESSDSD